MRLIGISLGSSGKNIGVFCLFFLASFIERNPPPAKPASAKAISLIFLYGNGYYWHAFCCFLIGNDFVKPEDQREFTHFGLARNRTFKNL